MIYRRIATLFLFVMACGMLAAQEVATYRNASWQLTDEEHAVYIEVNEKKDGLWHNTAYVLETKKAVRDAWFKDSANTIKHGLFRKFYPNGLLRQTGSYTDNRRNGAHFSYYPNGVMQDSFYFRDDIPYGYCLRWYPSGDVMTEMQMDSTGSGSGLVIGLFPDGVTSFKGKMAKGLRKTGNWFYYHVNGKRASVLQFPAADSGATPMQPEVKADAFEGTYYDSTVTYTNAVCYDLNGVQQSACTIVNSPAAYPNGLQGWALYLQKELAVIMSKQTPLPAPVVYTGYLMIAADGKPEQVMLDNNYEPGLDRNMRMVFQNSRKWIPAMHNNRNLPYFHIQSITLGAR